MKQKQLVIALGLTTSLGLVGCGGGDSGGGANPPTPTTSYSVKAIDGYLNGAIVWLDIDGDFVKDANEPSTTSGSGGNAILDISSLLNDDDPNNDDPSKYAVVVRAIKGKTVDEDTNKVVAADYVMSAPAGQTNVTPLSTLVHVEIERGDSADEAAAAQKIADQLGIPADDVLGDYIEDDNDEAAVGAKALVTSGTLPSTSEELKDQADTTDDGGFGGDADTLLSDASTINDVVKTAIDDAQTSGGADADISGIVVNDDGVADTDDDNDGVPNSDDKYPNDPDEWLDSDGDGTGDNADTDDDNDGTLDEDDEMPYDANEIKDSDLDGIGDNADTDDDNDGYLDDLDAFPTDGDEYLDTDKDGIGNNADTDDDGDTYLDDDDTFPLDSEEWVDNDGDKIGDNADLDDDGDGVLDVDDAFPNDSTETTDTDGDGIGDTIDTDDDGDGISDDNDLDPYDPNVGASESAALIEFMRESNKLYVGWADENDGVIKAQMEEFTLNGDIATISARYTINTDGTLTEIVDDSTTTPTATAETSQEFDRLILTDSGWVTSSENFELKIETDQVIVYPTAQPSYIYQVNGGVKTLDNLSIADNAGELEDIIGSDANYPVGAKAGIVSLGTETDKYELHSHKPWFMHGTGDHTVDGNNATSLTEIVSDLSAGETPNTKSIKGISIGYDVAVEFVTGGTANYYLLNWDSSSSATFNSYEFVEPVSTRVGTGTWSQSTVNGVDILKFSVPDAVQDTWGERYDGPENPILSVYNGYVYFGSFMQAGTDDKDHAAFLMNTIAKDALLGAVSSDGWLDTDKDGLGNNIDTDDDNDGVLDVEDAFPLDKSETTDTDKDGIGNNADKDDDGDGILDDQDAFPLDESESLDTDKDGIGNNADPDDDGDGVLDEKDLDPTDPNVGASQTAALIEFMRESTSLYIGWAREDNGQIEAKLEEFTLSGDIATVTKRYTINKDGSLTEEVQATAEGDFDHLILGADGWLATNDNYELKIDGELISLYPADSPDYVYQVSGLAKSLEGLYIHDHAGELDDIVKSGVTYPTGSKVGLASLSSSDDKYELYSHKPWFMRGTGDHSADGQNAVSLTEFVVAQSVGENPETGTIKGLSIGKDTAIEFVEGGVTNFYLLNWDTTSTAETGTSAPVSTLVGSGRWSTSTINNETILSFSIPESVQGAWGDRYHGDDHPILSVYGGYVYVGEHLPAGTTDLNDAAFLMNATAKEALLGAVDFPLVVCYDADHQAQTMTMDDFTAAINKCGGVEQPLTSEMLSGKNFQRVRSAGGTRDYTFNSDGTVDVYKDGSTTVAYSMDWVIEGDFVKITETSEVDSTVSYWAITDIKDKMWALLIFDDYKTTEVGQTSMFYIWATKVTEQALDAPDPTTCEITEVESGASYQDFLTQLNGCTNLPTMSIDETVNIYRINGDFETRAYSIGYSGSTSGNMLYFRNGQPKEMTWGINGDGVMEWKSGGVSDSFIRLIDENDMGGKVAFFEPDVGEIWVTTLMDMTPLSGINACFDGDSQWDETNERPVAFTTYSAFTSSFDSCLNTESKNARFSAADFFDRQVVLANKEDKLTFEANNTGVLEVMNETTGVVEETYNFTWSIEDADRGIVKIVAGYTDDNSVNQTATQYMGITSTNGVMFAVKSFWNNTAWESESDFITGGGEIFSQVYIHPEAETKLNGL